MTVACRQLVSSLRAAGLAWAVAGAGAIALPAQAAAAAPTAAVPVETKAAVPVGSTAGVAADLGRGLRYVRIDDFGAQLDAAAAALQSLPVVLDLRRVTAPAAAISPWREALRKAAADGRGAVFILTGTDTPSAVLAAVPESSRVVTLAAEVPGANARVLIKTSAGDDRAAYDAIVAGRSLAELTVEKIDKRRFDEARLAKAHADNGGRDNLGDDNDAAPAESSAVTTAEPEKAKESAPPKDLVLQRAVFLHRALVALNKLPAQS